MVNIIPRSKWGARHRAGFGARTLPTAYLSMHHSATLSPDLAFTDLNADSLDDDEVKAMRAIEDIGQQRFGGGFSYNVAFMPTGRIYEGCGLARVGAHTAKRNTPTMGIVLVGNYHTRQMPEPMRRAVVDFLRHGAQVRWIDAPRIDWGHRDLTATSCPGDHAYALIPQFNREAATAAPAPPAQEDDDMGYLDRNSSKGAVALLQTCLKNEGAAAGRQAAELVVDGMWGPKTEAALTEYQRGRISGFVHGRADGATLALLMRWEHRAPTPSSTSSTSSTTQNDRPWNPPQAE